MITIMWESVEQVFAGGIPRRLQPSEPLFHCGAPINHMFLVRAGQITLTRQTGAGAGVILQQARAGQVLAEASAYSATYHCDARAGPASSVDTIPVPLFRRKLAQDSGLAEAWAAHLALAVQSARMLSEIRTLRTVAERLDAWLGEGQALPRKGQWQDVAAQLGVTREALYRELAKRRARGVS